MAPKREADGFIKADPYTKRVKREGSDERVNLASIPMAPPTFAAPASSSAAVSKAEAMDIKPLDLGSAPRLGGRSGKREKRFFGSSITTRRGDDWVSAHFNKRDMVVALTISREWPSAWQSESVERELFQKLNKAKFAIAPAEDWGFIDRQSHINERVNTLFAFSISDNETHLHFKFTVKVRGLGQGRMGATMDAEENIGSGQHAPTGVEPN